MRVSVALLLTVLALALGACNGDGGSPAPPTDGGSDGGGGGTGGGGGSGDGGGTGGSGGDGSGGVVPPGGGGGGGGGVDGAYPQSATVAVERLDASGECDALLPTAAPSPVTVRVAPPAGAACAFAIADGTGAVAVAFRGGGGVTGWRAYGPDGALREAFAASELVPEPRGFQGLRVSPGPTESQPLVEHVAIDPQGAVASAATVSEDPASTTGFRWSFAQDPLGGSVVVFRGVNVYGNHWHGLRAHRFDPAGAARWPEPKTVEYGSDAAEPLFHVVGVSTRGEALLLYQDSAFLVVKWIDASGSTSLESDWTERYDGVLGSPALRFDLALKPLLDGGLALRVDGRWRRAYEHRAAKSGALPAWLAARTAWTYQFTRGNAGYAAFQPPGESSPDCTQRIDLVSPSGRLCGRVTLREGATGCTTGALDQGWDGTVVQQSGQDACAYRWWPRLLAGG